MRQVRRVEPLDGVIGPQGELLAVFKAVGLDAKDVAGRDGRDLGAEDLGLARWKTK